jgi:uncharacterized protein YllA (UPF0747 family)
LEHEYGVIARAAAEVDPTIERPVQTALHQALSGARDVEKRLLQHLKKREETEVGQIVRARTALLPLGRPQERVLTTAPFLARYGPEVLDLLRSEIVRWYQAGLEGAPVPT